MWGVISIAQESAEICCCVLVHQRTHTRHRSNLTIHIQNNRLLAERISGWNRPPCAHDFSPLNFSSRVHSWPPLSPLVSWGLMYRGHERSLCKQHPSNFLFSCCMTPQMAVCMEDIHPKHAWGSGKNVIDPQHCSLMTEGLYSVMSLSYCVFEK